MKYLFLFATVLANAEVVDSAAGGFTIKTTMNIQAAPDEVYRRLVSNICDWWNSAPRSLAMRIICELKTAPAAVFARNFPTTVSSGIWT